MRDFIKRYVILLCIGILVASCNKDLEELGPSEGETETPTPPVPMQFDVKMKETNTFKAGDTVKFILEGNANVVDFYSGTAGNDYSYRDKERFYNVLASLSFESNKTPANSNNIDCAELFYTTDFNGVYTYDNVKSADWQSLTNRFQFQSELQATSTTYLASGNVDITEVFKAGKPVYFAWLTKTAAGTNRTQFRVQNFKLEGAVADDSSLSGQLYSQMQFDFRWVLNGAAAAQASSLPTVTSTLLTWNGIFNNLTGSYKEGYAVSGPIQLPQFNAGKDMPTVIITKQKEDVLEHKYVYKEPGAYEVVFIASNTASNKQPEIIKKITITITN
jgi:hypothetical protein